jgi:hypothetical protein
VAPAEASWGALRRLYRAGLHDGAPAPGSAERGGASISEHCEAVCTRWAIDHQPIVSTQGDSAMHGMETPVPLQRRLFASQCSFTQTPAACERVPQLVRQTDNTTAQQGWLKDPLAPPLPLAV